VRQCVGLSSKSDKKGLLSLEKLVKKELHCWSKLGKEAFLIVNSAPEG
jgi:hypothetical protein